MKKLLLDISTTLSETNKVILTQTEATGNNETQYYLLEVFI